MYIFSLNRQTIVALMLSVSLFAHSDNSDVEGTDPFGEFGAKQSEIADKIDELGQAYWNALAEANQKYMEGLASLLTNANSIVIYLLDKEIIRREADDDPFGFGTEKRADEFPIAPYNGYVKYLKSVVLSDEEREAFLPVVANLMTNSDPMGGAMCHFPVHGIRILIKDQGLEGGLLFETSICWKCNNFYLTTPGGSYWTGLPKSGDNGFKILNNLLPIPEDRLKNKKEEEKNAPEAHAENTKG